MQLYIKGNKSNPELSNEFIKVSKTKNSLTFTTDLLVSLNDRMNELTQSIYSISNRYLLKL